MRHTDTPRHAPYWAGILAVAAGGGAGLADRLAHPLTQVLVILAALVTVAIASAQRPHPPTQALLTLAAALAGLALTGWPAHRTGAWVGVAAGLAIWAGAPAAWLRRRVPQLGPADGLIAVGLLAVASATLTLGTTLRPGPPPVHNLPLLVTIYLVTPPFEALVVWMALRRVGQWPTFLRRAYRVRPSLLSLVGLGLATGVTIELAAALVLALEAHWGIRPISNNPFAVPGSAALATPWSVAAIVFAVVVMAPLTEELLFRGLLFGSLEARWPYGVASVAAAAIFAAAHMDGSLFFALLAAGLLLNAVYRRSRSLIPSTVAHATFNGLSVLLAIIARLH